MASKVYDPYPLYRPAGVGPASKNDTALNCIRPGDEAKVEWTNEASANPSRNQEVQEKPHARSRQNDRPLR